MSTVKFCFIQSKREDTKTRFKKQDSTNPLFNSRNTQLRLPLLHCPNSESSQDSSDLQDILHTNYQETGIVQVKSKNYHYIITSSNLKNY